MLFRIISFFPLFFCYLSILFFFVFFLLFSFSYFQIRRSVRINKIHAHTHTHTIKITFTYIHTYYIYILFVVVFCVCHKHFLLVLIFKPKTKTDMKLKIRLKSRTQNKQTLNVRNEKNMTGAWMMATPIKLLKICTFGLCKYASPSNALFNCFYCFFFTILFFEIPFVEYELG